MRRSSLIVLMLLVGSPTLGLAQPKVPGAARAEKDARKLIGKWLKERSFAKLTRLEVSGRTRSAPKRFVYKKPPGTAFWKLLPKRYQKKVDKKVWCGKFSFPVENVKDSPAILEDARIDSIVVSRDTVLVLYSGHYVRLSPKWHHDGLADKRFTKDEKRSHNWLVMVKQRNKLVFAFERLEGDAKHALKEDSMAISGEPLLWHEWFKDRLSLNEVAVGHYESINAGKHSTETKARQEAVKKEREQAIVDMLKGREIGDVGSVDEVIVPKNDKDAPKGSGYAVKLSCGWFLTFIYIPEKEAKERQAFYEGLKKGDRVVYRCSYRRASKGLDAVLRTDGKPTMKRFKEGG